jgi:hypothetical protein
VARPKLRGTTEAFASQLFGKGVTKSNALESHMEFVENLVHDEPMGVGIFEVVTDIHEPQFWFILTAGKALATRRCDGTSPS